MKAIEVKPGIYWVGARDWGIRDFHGYRTQRGTSYNAYLVMDEQITLIDSVKPGFTHEMLERISSIIDPARIDVIVSNHVEMDHSGALPELMKRAPNARIVTSPNGEKGLRKHYRLELPVQVVKSGEVVKLGQRSLQFVLTPFVHWPDSMVCYMPEEKLLFSNDAFGQHLSIEHLFDDQCAKDVVFHEAAKYFANIVYLYTNQVEKALDALKPLAIDTIAPSHGVIWRQGVSEILAAYRSWCHHDNQKLALVVYDTMWGSTERMAESIRIAFEDAGIPVRVRNARQEHHSDIVTDVLQARYIAVGGPVLNTTIFPSIAAFMSYVKGLKPKGKIGMVFGSYGWDARSYKEIEDTMRGLEWQVPAPAQTIKYVPEAEELAKLADAVKAMLEAG